MFHQESASSYTSNKTRKILKNRKTNFLTPEEWMPMSPGADLMDFGSFWHLDNHETVFNKTNNILTEGA